MKNLKKSTIGDFMKDQGLISDKGEVKKKEQKDKEIKERAEKIKKKEEEDLKKIMEYPNYDPINEKDYSNNPFEKKSEISFSNYNKKETPNFLKDLPEIFEDPGDIYENLDEYNLDPKSIDEFTNEDSLYNFTKKESNIAEFNDIDQDDQIGNFEETDIINDNNNNREKKEFKVQQEKKEKKILQISPKYTDFEKKSWQKVVENYINQKGQSIGGREISIDQIEQINETIDKFKQNFPEDFAKMIHKKIMTSDLKWKKEIFKDKNILVSYYPNPEKPIIKYVLNLKDKDLEKKEPITKIFINNSVKDDGKPFKDKNGTVLIFCSKPVKKLTLKK